MNAKTSLVTGVILLIAAASCAALRIREARRDAVRSSAFGRLCQLRLALQSYEDYHGTLPPRTLKETDGSPTYSWLAAVLPYCEQQELFEKLDFTRAWDSVNNADARSVGSPFWEWYCPDGDYFPSAFLNPQSIWNPRTGSPRGLLKQFPDSIVLVAVPREGKHPLQPFTIDDQQLRRILEQGREALFIDGEGRYGRVRIEGGELAYVSETPRDRVKRD